MLAWRTYQDSLCPGCGHPKATAWHPDNDGWFTAQEPIVCHACTAVQEPGEDGTRKPVEFPFVLDTRDYATDPLPPIRPD